MADDDVSERSAAKCVAVTPEQIARAAALLRRGDVVAYPTETAYGLAADALNEAALARLAGIKGRSAFQVFSVIVSDGAMLARVVHRMPTRARALADRHWPGPLTLVLPAAKGLPEMLVNERGGVGVRMSPDPVAVALVRSFGGPVTATSANRSGGPAAALASEAALSGVAMVLDDGPRRAPVSTVVQALDDDQLIVLRAGPVSVRNDDSEVDG